MKCKRCPHKAQVHLRHHNAAFCKDCFILFFQRQVQRAVEKEEMFSRDEPLLVAVSGGKDSLALWEVLVELGYNTTGLHLALGIGEYSSHSTEKTKAFAERLGRPLITVNLGDDGATVPVMAKFTNRPACAACGTAKRHHFDRVAREQGFPVLVTGHNLDDEAARLLGNMMRWRAHHLAKQSPVLQAKQVGFVRKVKPLFRTSEYETAAYSFLRGIDYVVEECPNSVGATQLVFKEALNRIEAAMPGTKLSFLQEFLRNGQPLFTQTEMPDANQCDRCGMPCYGTTCSYCSLTQEVERKQQAAQRRAEAAARPPAQPA